MYSVVLRLVPILRVSLQVLPRMNEKERKKNPREKREKETPREKVRKEKSEIGKRKRDREKEKKREREIKR